MRDYGVDGQLGLEKTPECYVAKMVEIFSEVNRVLKDDGTLWLNLGDTYSAHKDCKSVGQTLAKGTNSENAHVIDKGKSCSRNSKVLKSIGLKNKDLVGIPWMVAFALRADGWYLRQDIIWSKPNPMPESVTDRCTKSHEYIFLMAKSQKYFYDNEEVQEPIKAVGRPRQFGATNPSGTLRNDVGNMFVDNSKRNKRSVWTVTTKPFKQAHFAVYPPDLIDPCILAGCPEGGIIIDPFSGSGTTALRSKQLGRKYIGIEINPDYCKIAEDRLRQEELF